MKKIRYYSFLFFACCFLLGSRSVKAQPCPVGIAYNIGSSGAVSFSAMVAGTNTSAAYFWSFGNNTSPVLSFSNGVSTTYTANGTYSVVLTYSTSVPNVTCVPTTTIININNVCGVNVNYSLPVPINACNGSATATPVGFCSSVSYNWMQGTVSIGSGPVVNALCKGTTYTVFASAAGGPTCCASSSGIFTVPNTTCGLTASFSNSTPSVTTTNVNFSSTSTGISNNMVYVWLWGDGSPNTTSTSPNALHTFTGTGAFSTTLRVINNVNLCRDSIIKSLVIPSSCSLSANFSSTNLGNGLFNFTSNSTGTNGGTTYLWRFGDGNNGSGLATSHTYSSSGTYTVKLIANNNSSVTICKDSISVPITVNLPVICTLTAGFTASVASTPSLAGVVFFANTSVGTIGASTYSWNWGDGNGSAAQSPTLHAYPANGTYVVTLLVTNSPSCASTSTQTVFITNITVPCTITANFTHTVGAFGVVNFTDGSSGTSNFINYFWDFGDGTYGGGNSPMHIYNYNGAYNVKLVVKDSTFSSCRDSIVYSLNITGLPCVANANFNLSPSGTPQYWNAIPAYPWNVTAATWTWGDGSSNNLLYTSHLYASPGTYSICLTVTVTCGATAGTCTSAAVFKSQNTTQDQTIVYINVLKPALVTAIGDQEQNDFDFVVYPNPNKGAFTLNVKGLNMGPANVAIYNMVGQLVYQVNEDSYNGMLLKELQLEQADNGIYFIKINAGNKVFTKKFIINKQ